jgi:hypothetical protein
MRKLLLPIIIVVILFIIGYTYFGFSGTFDKKYSREWLVKNFVQNERSFEELANQFDSLVSRSKQSDLTFGLSGRNRINLTVYPAVVDPANKIMGGKDLEFGSPELDTLLAKLGWTIESVKMLRKRLSETNCDWIRVIGNRENSISIYPNQTGWGKYSYVVLKEPVPDSSQGTYGRPLTDSGFGKRVVLNYVSAL